MKAPRTLGVWLSDTLVGYLTHYPDERTVFSVSEEYLDAGLARPILSLAWTHPDDEAQTRRLLLDPRHKSASIKAPPFFSNLLPEGGMRARIAQQLKAHELFCGAEDAVDLWTVIAGRAAALPPGDDDAGGRPLPALTPCGLAARDSLRLEAGMPLYGHELTEETTPYDASLGAVVKLDKPEFVGRQALAARAVRENRSRSEERRVGKECRSRWSPYH